VPVLLGVAVFADNPTEGVCFVLDLTERKKLEQQLLRTQRMESIGTLAGGIAHDLNNILAPILMSGSLLRRAQTMKAVEEIIPVIEGSARRAADVVRQLLIFGRGMGSESVLTQTRHLLKEMAKIVTETFPKNITLKCKLPNGLWPVSGDATQLHQLILNLCVNARDAMPDGGTLSLSATNLELDANCTKINAEARPGKYLKLEVSDTGIGIAPAVLDRIFEPFFTTKPIGQGTGLGLSTVMGIVKNHHGFITIHSELGKGSKFEVYLPAKADAVIHELDETAATKFAKTGQGERVLVVDDEVRILTATRRVLEAHGYAVSTAADGIEALAVFAREQEKISIVVTDLLMPLLDGFSLVRALKKMEPNVKIIITSGIAADDKWKLRITELESLGVSNILAKPLEPEVLLDALAEMLHETA
jgi:nitrogen-specific signal transduction histidine kinase/ActR/RegA family two-component response regulator